tara:strand:- start:97 stop:603 length:507 start_codon:yes stop_codon:yes gene_type:complete
VQREVTQSELEFFYIQTGEAIWQLQFFEEGLCKFYIILCVHFNCSGIDKENADIKLKQMNRKTLGQLIGLLEKTNKVPDSMLTDLKAFNELRKWVVHNSIRENGHDLYTDKGRESFALQMLKFTGMATTLHKSIRNTLMVLVTKAGYATQDSILKSANAEIDRLKGYT